MSQPRRYAVHYDLAYDGGGERFTNEYRTRAGATVAAWWNRHVSSWGGSARLEDRLTAPPAGLDFDAWVELGRANGFVVAEFCAAHDVPPYLRSEVHAARRDDRELLDCCAPSLRVLP